MVVDWFHFSLKTHYRLHQKELEPARNDFNII